MATLQRLSLAETLAEMAGIDPASDLFFALTDLDNAQKKELADCDPSPPVEFGGPWRTEADKLQQQLETEIANLRIEPQLATLTWHKSGVQVRNPTQESGLRWYSEFLAWTKKDLWEPGVRINGMTFEENIASWKELGSDAIPVAVAQVVTIPVVRESVPAIVELKIPQKTRFSEFVPLFLADSREEASVIADHAMRVNTRLKRVDIYPENVKYDDWAIRSGFTQADKLKYLVVFMFERLGRPTAL